jgi:hypothetical protein
MKPVCFNISGEQNALMTTGQLHDDRLIVEECSTKTLDGPPTILRPDRIKHREPTGFTPNNFLSARRDMVLDFSLCHGLAQFFEKRLGSLNARMPELPYFKVTNHPGKPSDMILLRMRGNDMVQSSNPLIQKKRRNDTTPHIEPLVPSPTIDQYRFPIWKLKQRTVPLSNIKKSDTPVITVCDWNTRQDPSAQRRRNKHSPNGPVIPKP